ncbi:uncharacterized protein CLUP02_16555 [Colletotrichum lupini]|uniref:Uncharacterized protein n=1 Tax=Colletotrichum lupini TaxID=145971 RepID=A0A9Q8TA16_9PEZI|nr:uncharacterized protein CLUP02_16555 [Colletotrichum lupini]UQC91022.1 hypothetical protein CLUP02_16555 [Colletotrichum lupini]
MCRRHSSDTNIIVAWIGYRGKFWGFGVKTDKITVPNFECECSDPPPMSTINLIELHWLQCTDLSKMRYLLSQNLSLANLFSTRPRGEILMPYKHMKSLW